MGALHGALTREHGVVSLVGHRLGRLLSAALLAVLVPATIAAAPAAAEPQPTPVRVSPEFGAVKLTTRPLNQCALSQGAVTTADFCLNAIPMVRFTYPQMDGQASNAFDFTVRNIEGGDAGDHITQVTVDAPPNVSFTDGSASERITLPNGDVISDATPCQPPGRDPVLSCDPPLVNLSAHGPAQVMTVHYRTVRNDGTPVTAPPPVFGAVVVEFNFGDSILCGVSQAVDSARAADACTPPSHTRITEAKITGNTALFRFTARRATSFECELVRNHRMMFRRSCHSPKPYANPLPHGRYMFIVTGINRGGIDPNPAIKKFTVH